MNRVLNVATMVISMVLFLICDQLNAAVVNITQGSTSGYTMTDGNTYVIQDSVSFSNATVSGSGISVESNSTVVIYVPKNVTLTASGANGEGRIGGGAGIDVPETSTLIITGEGMVVATGGNAGDGTNGGNGGNGWIHTKYSKQGYAGTGGTGGDGGGGAGAGIGGSGGLGGLAADGDGGNGEDGVSMGAVYVLGSMRIEASTGFAGIAGISGKSGGSVRESGASASGGGGGGGGGAGSAPTCSIGGGGPSGGAGGSGKKGRTSEKKEYLSSGSTGEGGFSLTQNGGGGNASNSYKGGLCGVEGGAGTLYVSSSANVDVERARLSATTHQAAQYTIIFDVNGGVVPSETNSVTATLGSALPDCIPTPIRPGYLLCGWKDGNGMQYYDCDGTKMLSAYSVLSNIILRAEWTIAPDALSILPANGTTFESSLTVSMSCPIADAMIRYTIDGSDPTIDSLVYKKFKIYGKTTVKAIAFCDDGSHSDVVTASYALGQCADPMFSLADGSEFEHSGQEVSIAWNNDGVLRYTLDGSEPTVESPSYEGPFTISESVVVKAKVFSDDFFDSSVVTASLTRVWVNVATPVIDAASSFTGSKTKVSISCATEGAVVRYTLNGNEPNSHSTKYTGPFYVTDSCTVKAYAVMPDYLNSEVATFAIDKVWVIGDAMGKPDHGFTTDGTGGAGWTRVTDATAPNGEAMKSGAIAHGQSSVLSTKVMGPGTLSFSWRTSCEQDPEGTYEWDHAELTVDGVVKLRLDGDSGWAEASTEITGDGEHTIEWRYVKDDVESAGDDAAWVANYSWASAYTATRTTNVPVPYAWLTEHDPDVVDEYDAYEAAAKVTGANGHKVWESYVIGADPNDKDDSLKITSFPMKADGTPDFEAITISPSQSKWNVDGAQPVLKGKATLEGAGEWQAVTDENRTDMRFFKVEVVLP